MTLPAHRLPLAALAAAVLAAAAAAADPAPRPRPTPAVEPDLDRFVDAAYPQLEDLYEHLHANPELSLEEARTASTLARELEATGFEVTRAFGGHGVVGVLRNGVGPTVLVRTEMDALPVEEKTGLPFASQVKARARDGTLVGVMHACGHDVHMTCWTGTARALAAARDRWQGTLVFIAQPGEEVGAGAEQMLKAGLYAKFPRPDYCLALHCDAQTAAGTVAFTPGLAMANIDMVGITVLGKGGHGAWPHMTVDPVVLAARVVLDLQTLVSRENDPTDPMVLTVGTIHGGVKANVIPNEVKLQLTVRTTREKTRRRVLDGIARVAKGAAVGAGAPEPIVNINPNWYTPAVLNDDKLTEKTVAAFRKAFGPERVRQRPPMMGGEDFALFGRAGVPSFLFFLGTQPADLLSAVENDPNVFVPSLHSDKFAPVPEPTIKAGVKAMATAVLNLTPRESTQVVRVVPERGTPATPTVAAGPMASAAKDVRRPAASQPPTASKVR